MILPINHLNPCLYFIDFLIRIAYLNSVSLILLSRKIFLREEILAIAFHVISINTFFCLN